MYNSCRALYFIVLIIIPEGVKCRPLYLQICVNDYLHKKFSFAFVNNVILGQGCLWYHIIINLFSLISGRAIPILNFSPSWSTVNDDYKQNTLDYY